MAQTEKVSFKLSPSLMRAIRDIAAQNNKRVSTVVREALAIYAKNSGVTVEGEIHPEWGGYRERLQKDDSDDGDDQSS